MGLRSLVLIDEKTMTRLDTGESVFGSDIQVLDGPVMVLVHQGDKTIKMNHTGKIKESNAVLEHKRYDSQLCSGSYVYVQGL
jgi:hypothetical protein